MSELDEYVWVGADYRLLKEAEKALIKRGRKSLKTNGDSQLVYIDHPDLMSVSYGDSNAQGQPFGRSKRKQRTKPTNYTPPKKKRK
jgi:hypothetical protein